VVDRHKPNSWDGYLAVHASKINDYLGYFILFEANLETHPATVRTRTGEKVDVQYSPGVRMEGG
jgi:hypothetical protein